MEHTIKQLIHEMNDAGNENNLAIDMIRAWLADLLIEFMENIQEFPEEKNKIYKNRDRIILRKTGTELFD